MPTSEVWDYLFDHCNEESATFYGHGDLAWIEKAADNWYHDERNYDGRWSVILSRLGESVQVLDVAAGCGTFLLHGLNRGFNVYGIEPEPWKLEYYRRKIIASGYDQRFLSHLLAATGEDLPFPDNSFDLVTTYQTLEHVRDVDRCLREMLRVLRPGGILYIRAPDYSGGYEPHYRLFMPRMPRLLARLYLRLRCRPRMGLENLNWVTERGIIRSLQKTAYPLQIQRPFAYPYTRLYALCRRLADWNLGPPVIRIIITLRHCLGRSLRRAGSYGHRENDINLWVTKK